MVTFLNVADLTVGQRVAVARSGHMSSHNLGSFVVDSKNKVRVTLRRETDNHTLTASVRTGRFAGYDGKLTDSRYYVEPVEQQEARKAFLQKEAAKTALFRKIEGAAANRSLEDVEALVAELKALG